MLACTGCGATLSRAAIISASPRPCGSCGSLLEAEVFPALFLPLPGGDTGEALISEDQSACFYHPQKQAVVPCDACGRFLCSLCDVEFNDQHLCPFCLETGQRKGKIRNLQNERVRHDRIALALALVPIVTFYFTVFTAPMAILYAAWHWRTPVSIVHRTKIFFVIATLVAGAQIAAWVALITFLVNRLAS